MHILPIFISALAISTISILGLVLVKSHKNVSRFITQHLTLLTAISAGIFLVSSYRLIIEALHILEIHNAIISFVIGIAAYILLHYIFSPHRHKGADHVHDEKKSAWKILIGDSIHNIADGLLLVASFGTSLALGYGTALSIALHEAPQEISEFLVLKKSGYTDTEAVYRNFGTALSIFVGVVIGLFLINTVSLQGFLLGATGTFFLGIVFFDLFPVKNFLQSKNKIQLFSALIIGVIAMSGINMLIGGHSHDHGGGDHSGHNHEHESIINLQEIDIDVLMNAEKYSGHSHDSHDSHDGDDISEPHTH